MPPPHTPTIRISCSTFRPSDHAYCQLYQFNSLTFHPFWQFHSMESNRSSSSINSYTFSSIGSITSINLIETIYSIISISFNIDSILDIIDCYQSQCCQLNISAKSGKNYTTGKHGNCFVPFQCILSFLENFLVQTAPLNLSVIPLLSSYLSIWLIPFSHNFHAIIPWIPSVPSITQFQFYQFQWL